MMSTDEPQVLGLTNWANELHQRLEGYREPSALFGRQHQRTVSRLLKTFTPENPTPSSKDVTKLRNWRLQEIERQIKNKQGYEPISDVAERAKGLTSRVSFVSGFLMAVREQTETCLPNTHRFAEELDQLAHDLIVQQWPGPNQSFEGYKEILLTSPLVRPEYWIEPVNHYDCRPFFEQAADWPEAWKLTHIVIFHLQISMLALWDAEYCSDSFRAFTSIPLFLNLAPRLRLRVRDQLAAGLQRLNFKKADIVDGPFSHLIDLIWCLLRFVSDGDWPKEFPNLSEMADDLKYEGDLAQLRAGRPNLTANLFEARWPNIVRHKQSEPIVPPFTLLAAAHLWDIISPPDRPPIPVDQCYMRAWQRHRQSMGTSQWATETPTIGWPSYLNRGLEISVPD
jgi:hypothetical protein